MQTTNELKTDKTEISGTGTTFVNRNYKDTVFRMLFREKENLLSLYNALNGISFVFDSELMLYEHQSTVNPNMPLRDLIYVTKVWQGKIREQNLYGVTRVRISAPRFVIFYNGTTLQPEQQILRLSESYEKEQEQPELELTVTIYNINPGCNQALMNSCQLLKEYAQYVEQVRINAQKMSFPEAVETAVDDCIRNGILSSFLSKHRAEAIEMCIFEFDEEKFLKSEREYSFREGHAAGEKIGREKGRHEGEARLTQLIQFLIDEKRHGEIPRALSDSAYREQLYLENHIV